MSDQRKTKAQLIKELEELRERVSTLERDAAHYGNAHDSACRDGQLDDPVETSAPGSPGIQLSPDATRQDRTGESLLESEAMYKSLVELSPDGIFLQEDDKIVFANPAMANLLGAASPDELRGMRILDLVHPDHQHAISERMALNLEEGLTAPLLEQRLVRLDGSFIDVEAIGAPVWRQGRRARQVIFREITGRKQAEESLRRSQAMLASILDSVPLAIFWKDVNGVYMGCNKVFAHVMGFQQTQMIEGKTDFDLPLAKEHAESYLAVDREVMTLNKPKHHIIEPLQQASGDMIWIETTKVPLKDEQDNTYGVLGVFQDITERLRAEDALKENDRFLSDMFASIKDSMTVLDRDLRIVRVNHAAENRYYWHKPLVGKKCYHVYGRGGDPCTQCPALRSLTTGKPAQEIVPRFGTDGEQIGWIDLNTFPLLDQETGQVKGVIEHARDITDKRRTEEEFLRLITAVEQVGETILITDPEGVILYANPAFETTTGYKRKEAVGRNTRILSSGVQPPAFYEEMWKTLSSGKVWRGEFTNRKKDGSLYHETATISPIKDSQGKVVNYVAVKRDITGEAILQRQLMQAQKMEALGTLAGGIAHDFNNLLQAILGYSDLLLMKKKTSDPDFKKLEIIQHAARDGADLVSRILTFSRKAESKIYPIDLNFEIRRVEKLLRRTLPRMIQIDLNLADNLDIIDADPSQIEQILLNLGGNAQHAMPDGGQLLIETCNVSLSDEYLRTHLGATPGHYVCLTISDTGVGMESAVMDRIFEPFFTTKTESVGTGLGLSIVHGIVSQHGGYIRCYSEPGSGTSFKIYFPVSASDRTHEGMVTREMPAFGTETILLVDDDDRVREMGRQMIELGGYKVITARSGEEALATYGALGSEISLVVLDLIMPGMGGQRCLEEMLALDPEVKAIIASGYSSNGLATNGTSSGARGFIGKPYDAKDILAAIRKTLDRG